MQFDTTNLRNQRDYIDIEYQIDRLTRDLARKKPLVATGGATVGQIDDLEAELKRYQGWRGARQGSVAARRGVPRESDRAHEHRPRNDEQEHRDRAARTSRTS